MRKRAFNDRFKQRLNALNEKNVRFVFAVIENR